MDAFGTTSTNELAPPPVSAFTQSTDALARKQSTGVADYIGSMWRQDSITDPLMAHIVGKEMAPDDTYNPFSDPMMAERERHLPDELKSYLYTAHSPAHGEYLYGLLLDKQRDLTRLNDLGFAGNAGRLLLGVVNPENVALGLGTGLLVRGGVGAVRAAAVARASGAIGKAEAAAAATARTASFSASTAGKAALVGGAAGTNAAAEYVRQQYAHENDDTLVAAAALFGVAFTTPVLAWSGKHMTSAAAAAQAELDAVRTVNRLTQGLETTPAEVAHLRNTVEVSRAAQELNEGRITIAQFERRQAEATGSSLPDSVWLDQFQERIRAQGQQALRDVFGEMATTPVKPRKLSPEAAAQLDARVARETEAFRASNTGAGEALVPSVEAAVLRNPEIRGDFAEKLAAAMQLGRERSAKERVAERSDMAAALERAKIRAQVDQMWASVDARKEAELTAIQNARDLQLADIGADPLAHKSVPDISAPKEAPAAAQAPQADPLASWAGRAVSWQGRDGDTLDGVVLGPSKTPGKILIDTGAGPDGIKIVDPRNLDQWDGGAPDGFTAGSAGFGADSIGAARANMDGVDLETAGQRTFMASVRIPGTDVDVPLRLDVFATLNASNIREVRELAYKLVKDPIGNDYSQAQGWTASERKRHLMRTIVAPAHREIRGALADAIKARKIPVWKRARFTEEFMQLPSQLRRGGEWIRTEYADILPQIERAVSAMDSVYAKSLDEMKRAGVRGADEVEASDFYVNRVWHPGNIRKAILDHGEDSVVHLLAGAITDKAGVLERMRKGPGNALTEHVDPINGRTLVGPSDSDLLKAKAKSFLNTVRNLEFSQAMQDLPLHGRDMGTIRSNLKALGVGSDDIDNLVDLMFTVRQSPADSGRISNLKFRFGLDEGAEVTTQAGKLRFADLLENDSRMLLDRYANSTLGHTAMAHAGFADRAAFDSAMQAIAKEAASRTDVDPAAVKKHMALLEDVYNHIVGRPLSTADFSALNRGATALRGYTRGVMLGQLGLVASYELTKAAAMLGFRSGLRQMPSLRSFLTALRQGFLPDEGLSRDVASITGFGYEKFAAYSRANEIEQGFAGQLLSRGERFANEVSYMSDVISGNASITSLSKQLSGMMAAQQLHDFATGFKRLTPKMRERLVMQGVSQGDLDSMLKDLRKFSTHENHKLQQVRHEDWLAESPDSYQRFQLVLERQVRDAIQDQDFGETMPFMHTTLGKVFAELRTFMLVGHAKNFLKNAHAADATSATIFMTSLIAECLAYSTQTALNYPDQLEERLAPDAVVKAALGRMSALGITSLVAETGYQTVTGNSLLGSDATANTGNRNALLTPSMIIGQRLGTAVQSGTNALLGTDIITRKEAKDSLTALPFSSLPFVKAGVNYWANTFPTSDPDKQP